MRIKVGISPLKPAPDYRPIPEQSEHEVVEGTSASQMLRKIFKTAGLVENRTISNADVNNRTIPEWLRDNEFAFHYESDQSAFAFTKNKMYDALVL